VHPEGRSRKKLELLRVLVDLPRRGARDRRAARRLATHLRSGGRAPRARAPRTRGRARARELPEHAGSAWSPLDSDRLLFDSRRPSLHRTGSREPRFEVAAVYGCHQRASTRSAPRASDRRSYARCDPGGRAGRTGRCTASSRPATTTQHGTKLRARVARRNGYPPAAANPEVPLRRFRSEPPTPCSPARPRRI